jgi:hypothetical protein
MAFKAIMFIFFYGLHIFLFFLQFLTFENERSTAGFWMWKGANTQIFYNSGTLYIVRILQNTLD